MDLGQESYLQLVQVGVLLVPGLLELHEVRGTLVELHQQHLGDQALVRPPSLPPPWRAARPGATHPETRRKGSSAEIPVGDNAPRPKAQGGHRT